MVQLVNKRVMSLVILGIMVLCGASKQVIGVVAIASGVMQIALTFATKAVQNNR
jgi:hypothetical protein